MTARLLLALALAAPVASAAPAAADACVGTSSYYACASDDGVCLTLSRLREVCVPGD